MSGTLDDRIRERALGKPQSRAFVFLQNGEVESDSLVIVHEVGYGPRPDTGQVIGSIQKAVARDHHVFADAVVLIRPGSLPKTTSGKIRRRSCGMMFQTGELEAIGSWRNWE